MWLTVLAPLASAWLASAAWVHWRGRERLPLHRQLFDHSTILAPYTALVTLLSGRVRGPRFPVDHCPELAKLRESWPILRQEAEALLASEQIGEAEKRDDIAFNSFFRRGWRRFYLKWYGESLPSAGRACPKSVALVESIPTVNAALFALLLPGARLGRHRDPFAGSLRYHLGLKTPGDGCRLFVDGEPYVWHDGEDVLFDETYVHGAKNETDRPRLILFCDVTRPIERAWLSRLNGWVIRHIVPISASRNEDAEPLGLLNHLAAPAYAIKQFTTRLKKKNKRLYWTVKYTLLAAVIVWLIVAVF